MAAGLLVKGLVKMHEKDVGFNPNDLITARVVLPDSKSNDPGRIEQFKKDALGQIRMLPGIRAASLGNFIPYGGNDCSAVYAIEGRPIPASADRQFMLIDTVSPEYFSVMGIPLVHGRLFSELDRADSPPVSVVNQSMVRRQFSGQDPVGRRIRWSASLDRVVTIVGVVKDAAGQDDTDRPYPQVYFPYQQYSTLAMTFVLRTHSVLQDTASSVRRALHTVDPSQAVWRVETMHRLMAERRAPYIIVGQLSSFFAARSLFLAALGIYGVMAHSVAARKQEFGILLRWGRRREI